MRKLLSYTALLACVALLCGAQTPDSDSAAAMKTTFRVRYVAADAVYIEGGRSAGLSEGMKLVIKGQPPAKPGARSKQPASTSLPANEDASTNANPSPDYTAVAELKVMSVAETSAVCEVISSKRTIVVGDFAALSNDDVEKMVEKRAIASTRIYPAVVSFTEGDPLDEEVRDAVPRPPLPEVNRAQGRIGFDYSTIVNHGGTSSSSSQAGLILRADITRINGTYWNLSGYWRGSLQSNSSQTQTLQDLMNRTYHMSLTYANPNSKWVAGFGRMYVPWASSLETIDGAYFGRRVTDRVTTGLFAGTTPEPTSWSYNPNRRIAGTFVNVAGGSYEDLKYSSTWGFGVSMLGWTIDRPFGFGENDISYKRVFSIYHSFQIDRPTITDPTLPKVGAGLGQSFFTFRVQPHPRVSFDLNHSYFRDVPTYDPQLVGTGLLDKYLFQGLSGGVRVELPRHLTVYTNIGRSSTSKDARSSWNTMYGVTLGQIWRTGLRADVRYSKFDSAFARGAYQSFSLSRNFGEGFRLEAQAGKQSYLSQFTNDNGSHFVNVNVDLSLRAHYFLQGGYTRERGSLQNYNQFYTTFGYRFDNRGHHGGANAN